MPVARALARQLGRPSGPFGRVVGALLDRTNAATNRHAIALLQPAPEAHVLEVGFGGGAALAELVRRTPRGRVVGLEVSETMLARARQRFRSEIAQGRVSLLAGSAEDVPAADASFDAVLTVHTIYFWADPAAGIGELHRVLRPGGSLLVAVRRPDQMKRIPTTRHGFRLFSAADLERLLDAAGFVEPHTSEHAGVIFVSAQRV